MRGLVSLVTNRGFVEQFALANDSAASYFYYIERRDRLAQSRLVAAHLAMVPKIAEQYRDRGVACDYLIEAGTEGLRAAASKFRHRKGYKFTTYATWWIRQRMTKEISDATGAPRLPVEHVKAVNALMRAHRLLLQTNGRAPTKDEFTATSGLSMEHITKLWREANECSRIHYADDDERKSR